MLPAEDMEGAAPPISVEPSRVLMPSPLGALGVELRGSAVSLLRFDPAGAELETFIPLHRLDGEDLFDEIFGRLSEYFAGARRKLELAFDFGPCDAHNVQARRVLKEAARIPYGRTRTFQALAEAVNVPEGASRVEEILSENPLPILIPCHRAVAHPTQIGAYVGGAARKRWLLDLEQRGIELL
jgi:methylated-DNA-[protein]-cysteine S-methyltransferase